LAEQHDQWEEQQPDRGMGLPVPEKTPMAVKTAVLTVRKKVLASARRALTRSAIST
jgi:hypothetical protein